MLLLQKHECICYIIHEHTAIGCCREYRNCVNVAEENAARDKTIDYVLYRAGDVSIYLLKALVPNRVTFLRMKKSIPNRCILTLTK